jgi:hypothetical protein
LKSFLGTHGNMASSTLTSDEKMTTEIAPSLPRNILVVAAVIFSYART